MFIKISEQAPFTLSIINKQRNSEAGSLSEIRHYKVNVEIIKKGSRWLHFCRLRRMKRITKFRVDRSNRYAHVRVSFWRPTVSIPAQFNVFSSFDKLEDLVKSYKDRRGGLCCKLVSNFVDPPDDYGPVIDYEDLFWDLSSESILLGPKLGEGSFGTESVNKPLV